MNADGFLNQKQRHPVALTAAVAINLAAVTAVLLAKNGYVKPIEGILIGENIPIFEPPPPNPPEAQPKSSTASPTVFTPVPQVPSEPSRSEPSLTGSGEPVLTGGGTTAGPSEPIVEPEPAKPPLPVLTEAVPLPSAAREFQPPYPTQLLRTGVEGKAVVRVLIGADGRVKQVAVIAADDPLFADATERQALRRWRFRPATQDGAPVESWKQLTVRFEIRS